MERVDILNDAMAAPETIEIVPGVPIRKINMQSLAMLGRIGSPFADFNKLVSGITIPADQLADFIFIHAAPISVVRKLVYQPKRELFSESADTFMASIPMKKVGDILKAIWEDVEAIRAAEANVIPDAGNAPSKNVPSPAA